MHIYDNIHRTHMPAHMPGNVCVCVCTYTCTDTNTYTYSFAYTYSYTYTYTYIYMHTCLVSSDSRDEGSARLTGSTRLAPSTSDADADAAPCALLSFVVVSVPVLLRCASVMSCRRVFSRAGDVVSFSVKVFPPYATDASFCAPILSSLLVAPILSSDVSIDVMSVCPVSPKRTLFCLPPLLLLLDGLPSCIPI